MFRIYTCICNNFLMLKYDWTYCRLSFYWIFKATISFCPNSITRKFVGNNSLSVNCFEVLSIFTAYKRTRNFIIWTILMPCHLNVPLSKQNFGDRVFKKKFLKWIILFLLAVFLTFGNAVATYASLSLFR